MNQSKGYIQFTLLGNKTQLVDRQTIKHLDCKDEVRMSHHSAEVFIQNLHKVMDQFVDGQLVLRETDRH